MGLGASCFFDNLYCNAWAVRLGAFLFPQMHYIILTGSPSMKQAENIECREMIIDCYSEADSKTLIGEQQLTTCWTEASRNHGPRYSSMGLILTCLSKQVWELKKVNRHCGFLITELLAMVSPTNLPQSLLGALRSRRWVRLWWVSLAPSAHQRTMFLFFANIAFRSQPTYLHTIFYIYNTYIHASLFAMYTIY